MTLNSSTNMQVSGIAESLGERLFVRAFSDDRTGIPVTRRTLVIEGNRGDFRLLRTIDDEIVSLNATADRLILTGKFGHVYVYDGRHWHDHECRIEPLEYVFRTVVHNDRIYVACTGGTVARFHNGRWESIARDVGGDDLDLIGICHERDDSFLVCGDSGLLASVGDNGDVRIMEVSTTRMLVDVCKLEEDRVAVCGRNGTFLVGSGDDWRDWGLAESNANLNGMALWRGQLFVSAGDHVCVLDDSRLLQHAAVPSLHLAALTSALWSIGLKKLHRFDGSRWEDVIVELRP